MLIMSGREFTNYILNSGSLNVSLTSEKKGINLAFSNSCQLVSLTFSAYLVWSEEKGEGRGELTLNKGL